MKFFTILVSILAFNSFASAQAKKYCRIGSTNGIFYKFEKSVGTFVKSPLDGPVKNLIAGVSIIKTKGFLYEPNSPDDSQAEVTKKDFLTIRLALFTKEDFVSVEVANGQLTSAEVSVPAEDRPFYLSSVQGTGMGGDPKSYEHQIWLQCD